MDNNINLDELEFVVGKAKPLFQGLIISDDEPEERSYPKFTVIPDGKKEAAASQNQLLPDDNVVSSVPNQGCQLPVSVQNQLLSGCVSTYIACNKELERGRVKRENEFRDEEQKKRIRKEREEQKEKMREQREERRRSQYQEVQKEPDGSFTAKTRNLTIEAKSRKIVNFSCQKLRLLSNQDRTDKLYELEIAIENQIRYIYIDADRLGDPKYLLRKVTAAGGRFYSSKTEARYEDISLMIVELLKEDIQPNIIPDKPGWMFDEDGELCFYQEGGLLWPKAKKLAS